MAENRYQEIAGSGLLRVSTARDVSKALAQRTEFEGVKRTGTDSDLFATQIADFWANLGGTSGASSATLLERVWVANRCLHMNANAISSMPLRHYGGRKPAWVANPDPVWYPNGIADALYAIVSSFYGHGDAFVYVTSRYADGYPSAWTVLDAANMTVEVFRGQRTYRLGQNPLNATDMVQISRNPAAGSTRGSSAIKAYSPYANSLLAAADLGRVMMSSGGTPNAVIKSTRKVDEAQARKIQEMWMTAASARRGAPAVLPPELDFQQLAFSPEDLMLLGIQQWDSTVLATAFGIPAQLVNLSIEGGLNYQTPVLLLELWWRTELSTTAYRVAQALSSNMLPLGSYVELDHYKFVAPPWKELVDGWVAMVEKGLATVEQSQVVVLGLPPEAQVDATAALASLSTPPSAGASPTQQPPRVVELRPTNTASNY